MTTESLTPDRIAGYQEERRQFLDLIGITRRSTVTNLFLQQARQGLEDPTDVVAGVLSTLAARIAAPWASDLSRGRESLTLGIVEQHPAESEGFARWAISYAELSREEVQHHKREAREQHVNAWLENQAPTERQVAYLRSMGCSSEVASKLEASRLIESLKAGGRNL